MEEVLVFCFVGEEELLYPNEYIVIEEMMLGPFALVVYPEGTPITKMLLAVLTEFVRVVLLTLLADDFTWMPWLLVILIALE